MKTTFTTHCEQLEDRTNPASFGTAWLDPSLLTISFAADQTAIVSYQSELFDSLNTQNDSQAWQTEILRAFQTWAVWGNVNLAVVQDSGDAFGTAGFVQGDSRFGDIRIGGYAQSSDVLAVASPFDLFSGTWSGDVFLNTSYDFGIQQEGMLDLFSVLVHEAGHVFGLPGNAEIDSVMYQHYEGIRSGLSSFDISAFQDLYGARLPDANEGLGGNNTLATATAFKGSDQSANDLYILQGDISSNQDVDYFSFRTGAKPAEISINLRTNGISLLTSRLIVQDGQGNVIANLNADGPLDDDLFVVLGDLAKNTNYYIRLESGTDDVFGIGAYRLEIDLDHQANDVNVIDAALSEPDVTTVDEVTRGPKTQSFASAVSIKNRMGNEEGTQFYIQSHLHGTADLDLYRIQSPNGDTDVMTLTLRRGGDSQLSFKVTVYDVTYNPIETDVLINDDGTITVEARDLASNGIYYIGVTAGEGSVGEGDYILNVQFGETEHLLETLFEGELSTQAESTTLDVTQNALYHFALGATDATVNMSITDSNGIVVFSLVTRAGDIRTGNVFLRQGDYTVTFESADAADATYQLRALVLTDPIGPQPEGVLSDPITDSGLADGGYVPPMYSPDTTNPQTVTEPPADWLATEDPYSNLDWMDYWTLTPPDSDPGIPASFSEPVGSETPTSSDGSILSLFSEPSPKTGEVSQPKSSVDIGSTNNTRVLGNDSPVGIGSEPTTSPASKLTSVTTSSVDPTGVLPIRANRDSTASLPLLQSPIVANEPTSTQTEDANSAATEVMVTSVQVGTDNRVTANGQIGQEIVAAEGGDVQSIAVDQGESEAISQESQEEYTQYVDVAVDGGGYSSVDSSDALLMDFGHPLTEALMQSGGNGEMTIDSTQVEAVSDWSGWVDSAVSTLKELIGLLGVMAAGFVTKSGRRQPSDPSA